MSDRKMNEILDNQKARRDADLLAFLGLFAGVFYTAVSLFA